MSLVMIGLPAASVAGLGRRPADGFEARYEGDEVTVGCADG